MIYYWSIDYVEYRGNMEAFKKRSVELYEKGYEPFSACPVTSPHVRGYMVWFRRRIKGRSSEKASTKQE